jgi:hypothetical protein
MVLERHLLVGEWGSLDRGTLLGVVRAGEA